MNNTTKTNMTKNDYFSDDEPEENELDDENLDAESDDSMDEETKRIIWEASRRNYEKMEQDRVREQEIMMNKLLNTKITKENVPEIKSNNSKPKKSISLNDFNKKVEQEELAKKPKKFVSKRVMDKKKQSGVETEVKPKRQFNPRLPPFNFVRKQKQDKVQLNSVDFPSLK